jgi:hypothetical protein
MMMGDLAVQAGRTLLQAAHDAHAHEEAAGKGHDAHAGETAAEHAAHSSEPKAVTAAADPHEGHGHGAHGSNDGKPTLDLRVGAIFCIFGFSLLAGLLPIFVRRLASPDASPARALRTFAGGTILGLALVSEQFFPLPAVAAVPASASRSPPSASLTTTPRQQKTPLPPPPHTHNTRSTSSPSPSRSSAPSTSATNTWAASPCSWASCSS